MLVAVSLAAIFAAALPALRELARAARSAEKLFDTLNRELPPTLESIRLTGMEISDLTDDLTDGIQSAGQIVRQVDQSIGDVRRNAKQAQVTTRSVVAGVKAAWKVFRRTSTPRSRPADRLPSASRAAVQFDRSQPTAAPSAAPSKRPRDEGQRDDLGCPADSDPDATANIHSDRPKDPSIGPPENPELSTQQRLD